MPDESEHNFRTLLNTVPQGTHTIWNLGQSLAMEGLVSNGRQAISVLILNLFLETKSLRLFASQAFPVKVGLIIFLSLAGA